MFDLSKSKITINCPECTFSNKISLGDVQKEKSIICKGCLRTIKLVDSVKSTKKAIKGVNQELNELQDSLKRISK